MQIQKDEIVTPQLERINKALEIQSAIFARLPHERRGFFKIGSTVIVPNTNRLEITPWRVGYLDKIILDNNGLQFVIRIYPFRGYYVRYCYFEEIYHSIKDFAEHNMDYLIGRSKEYDLIFENNETPKEQKEKYKVISHQIKHVLAKVTYFKYKKDMAKLNTRNKG